MKVIKNLIFFCVVKKVGLDGLDEVFIGLIVVVFSNDDVVVLVKIIDEFVKDVKVLEIKGGVIEGKVFLVE